MYQYHKWLRCFNPTPYMYFFNFGDFHVVGSSPEVLVRYANEEQKQRWLEPLLRGEIRSAFAMTEPDVASSDATNMAARAERQGDEWVINGKNRRVEVWVH